jgi:hypothetical protein
MLLVEKKKKKKCVAAYYSSVLLSTQPLELMCEVSSAHELHASSANKLKFSPLTMDFYINSFLQIV